MADRKSQEVARWMPLLVVGISLNTIGIVLRSLGPARFLMMGAGLVLLLISVLKLMAAQGMEDPPSEDQ